jgi:hypothetical protein
MGHVCDESCTWCDEIGSRECCKKAPEILQHVVTSHLKGYFQVNRLYYKIYKVCETVCCCGYNAGCKCPECQSMQFYKQKYELDECKRKLEELNSKLQGNFVLLLVWQYLQRLLIFQL